MTVLSIDGKSKDRYDVGEQPIFNRSMDSSEPNLGVSQPEVPYNAILALFPNSELSSARKLGKMDRHYGSPLLL